MRLPRTGQSRSAVADYKDLEEEAKRIIQPTQDKLALYRNLAIAGESGNAGSKNSGFVLEPVDGDNSGLSTNEGMSLVTDED